MKNIIQETTKLLDRFLADGPAKNKFIELVNKSKTENEVEVCYAYFMSELLGPANFTDEEKNALLFVFTTNSYSATLEINNLRSKLALLALERLVEKYGNKEEKTEVEAKAKSILDDSNLGRN